MVNKQKSRGGLDVTSFRALLERIYLGGLIEECFLVVEGGIGRVTAIDMTNSVLLDVQEELTIADGQYGLSQLPVLIKFLRHCQEDKVVYSISGDARWLTLRRKGKGKLSALLLEEDFVPTRLDENPDISGLLSDYSCECPLTNNFVENALYYTSLVGGQGVSFSVVDGNAVLSSASKELLHFETPVGKGLDCDNLNVRVYSDQLRDILSVLQVGEESRLHLREDHPVIIMQDGGNYWALTPIVS